MTPIADTGPLIALLDRDDTHHQWAVETVGTMRSAVVTCEAVIAETLFLCMRNRVRAEPLFVMLETGAMKVEETLGTTPAALTRLMRQWENVPMSLADAGLVALHQRMPRSFIVTIDSDFTIYRRASGRALRTLMPRA